MFHGKFQTNEDLQKAHASDSNRAKMEAKNVIQQKALTQVEEMMQELTESAFAIQDAQKHELAACFSFIEQLSEFEDDYTFWQMVQVLVIVVVVAWQILSLRSFFYAKKLVV